MATCVSKEATRAPDASSVQGLVSEHCCVDQVKCAKSSGIFEGDCTTLAGIIQTQNVVDQRGIRIGEADTTAIACSLVVDESCVMALNSSECGIVDAMDCTSIV